MPPQNVHTQIPRTCECMTSHSKISFAHVSKLRTIQWNPKGLYEQKREHEGQRRWCVDASRVRSLLERPPAEDLSTSRSWRGWGELDSPSSPEKQHDPWLSQWGPFQISNLQNYNKCVLFKAATFVVTCYNSERKLIHPSTPHLQPGQFWGKEPLGLNRARDGLGKMVPWNWRVITFQGHKLPLGNSTTTSKHY